MPLYGGFARGTFECAGLPWIPGLLTRVKAATFHSVSSEYPVAPLNPRSIKMIKATSETTLEQSLLHISDLLRCCNSL